MLFSKKYNVYFHNDVGRYGLEIDPRIKFRLPQSFSLSVTCTYIMYWLRLFFGFFPEKYIVDITLTMTMFVGSQSFIYLPSFMFVSGVVSEMCESNWNKKEKEKNLQNSYFTPFPGIPYFHLLTISTLLEV